MYNIDVTPTVKLLTSEAIRFLLLVLQKIDIFTIEKKIYHFLYFYPKIIVKEPVLETNVEKQSKKVIKNVDIKRTEMLQI